MVESKTGPGYETPDAAYNCREREKLLYVICLIPDAKTRKQPDYLAVIDVDPQSDTYGTVIHRTYMTNIGDELHHFGWNTCSSCFSDPSKKRNHIVLPAFGSDRIYVLNTENEKQPFIEKIIEPEDVRKFGVTALHTTHCLPSSEVMISSLGDADGNGQGNFVVLDSQTFDIKGLWTVGKAAKFGYDFWYQPFHDVLVASEWGAPRSFRCGFNNLEISDETLYGQSLNVYSWSERKLLQTIDLGVDGKVPLEIRFLHNPKASQGYVGCATGNIYRFYKKDDGSWAANKVINIPSKKVEGWIFPEMEGLITDILISMDDKYLYFSNWTHGDIRQYDISDTENPKLVGQIFLGGKLINDSNIKLIEDPEAQGLHDPVYVKSRRLYAAPQMFQLSLDGKRMYVTTSLFSPWDIQFYPEILQYGSTLVKLNVDTENGGLSLEDDFLVDFGKEPCGPVLAHEIRYPGGDCTSDIFIVDRGSSTTS